MNAQTALRFRRPMQVRELARYRSGGTFPLCPQCGAAMEREYQKFAFKGGSGIGV